MTETGKFYISFFVIIFFLAAEIGLSRLADKGASIAGVIVTGVIN